MAISEELVIRFFAALEAGDIDTLRDILFSWWEERFLAAHSGAPAIGSEGAAQT